MHYDATRPAREIGLTTLWPRASLGTKSRCPLAAAVCGDRNPGALRAPDARSTPCTEARSFGFSRRTLAAQRFPRVPAGRVSRHAPAGLRAREGL